MTRLRTFYEIINFDGFVKSMKSLFPVIPAEAGIQFFQVVTTSLDSGFYRSDDFLRDLQFSFLNEIQRSFSKR
jgi:hypothetical protein